ncbi:MAG: prolipoprotein diacylglyceryl transferase [Verrucomicrobia bacterium]|nr:prolipoprotein diacylglyceryl transferase [Verrucomicrobiota bacterium]
MRKRAAGNGRPFYFLFGLPGHRTLPFEMLGYYIHDLNPFLIEFGSGWGIRYYGLAYVTGFLAWYYGLRWFRTKGWSVLSDEQISELLLYTVLGVLVGGRLGYCVLYDWAETARNPINVIAFWHGGLRGMASHGGIAGALVGFLLWARKARCDGWAVADNAAVLAPVGIFFGRVANFINGELWGRASEMPWAVIFPDSGTHAPRHPSQVYEAFGEGVLLGWLMFWLRSRNPKPSGQVAAAFFMVYGLIRVGLEMLREPDPGDPLWAGFSRGQWFSVGLCVCGAALWRWRGSGSKGVRD